MDSKVPCGMGYGKMIFLTSQGRALITFSQDTEVQAQVRKLLNVLNN